MLDPLIFHHRVKTVSHGAAVFRIKPFPGAIPDSLATLLGGFIAASTFSDESQGAEWRGDNADRTFI